MMMADKGRGAPAGATYGGGAMPPMDGMGGGGMGGMPGTAEREAVPPEAQPPAPMVSAAPQPEKPYTVKVIENLAVALIDAVDALAGQEGVAAEAGIQPWKAPEGTGPHWPQPLPVEVYAPIDLIFTKILPGAAGGKFASKYALDPQTLTGDGMLRKATGMLGKMAKDKALAEAMQAPTGGPPPAGPAPAESEQMDRDLMGAM